MQSQQRLARNNSSENFPAGIDGGRNSAVQVVQTREIIHGGEAPENSRRQVVGAGLPVCDERCVDLGHQWGAREQPPKILRGSVELFDARIHFGRRLGRIGGRTYLGGALKAIDGTDEPADRRLGRGVPGLIASDWICRPRELGRNGYWPKGVGERGVLASIETRRTNHLYAALHDNIRRDGENRHCRKGNGESSRDAE